MNGNHYEILGVSPSSSLEQIRAAFQRLALFYHPDKFIGSAEEKHVATIRFLKIKESWNILSDSSAKHLYDQSLMMLKQSNSEEVGFGLFRELESGVYAYECRCGDKFEITQDDLDEGYNTVQCNGCSLSVTVV